eukprot:5712570-Pleurochrysis_carterae.AAC.6
MLACRSIFVRLGCAYLSPGPIYVRQVMCSPIPCRMSRNARSDEGLALFELQTRIRSSFTHLFTHREPSARVMCSCHLLMSSMPFTTSSFARSQLELLSCVRMSQDPYGCSDVFGRSLVVYRLRCWGLQSQTYGYVNSWSGLRWGMKLLETWKPIPSIASVMSYTAYIVEPLFFSCSVGSCMTELKSNLEPREFET